MSDLTPDQVLETISYISRCTVEEAEGGYTFALGEHRSQLLSHVELDKIVEEIASYNEIDEIAVATPQTYEVLLQRERRPTFRFALRGGFVLDDPQEGLTYQIDRPSAAYLTFIVNKMHAADQHGARRVFGGPPPMRLRSRLESGADEWSIIELLESVASYLSLKISSTSPKPDAKWESFRDALLFHLGYNLDLSLVPHRYVDEILRPSRISTLRRSSAKDLDPPRRQYNSDLVYHYQLGVSAESPMLEYLSYYHVAEHWFENVFQEDLVKQTQNQITSPDFSYKRKKDIQKLIRSISKAVQVQNEEVVINEQTALRLTLERFVDLDRLVVELNQFDPELVQRYKRTAVSFSEGDRVNLDDSDQGAIYSALARRLYKTRNSLVHSKDGAKNRFIPFAHDAELLPELPLIRFIAEQIISASSSMVG